MRATGGGTRTAGAIRLLDIAVDAWSVVGPAWMRLQGYADREGLTEGEALGKLAKLGLETNRKRKT